MILSLLLQLNNENNSTETLDVMHLMGFFDFDLYKVLKNSRGA
jgi:hypothetical protein